MSTTHPEDDLDQALAEHEPKDDPGAPRPEPEETIEQVGQRIDPRRPMSAEELDALRQDAAVHAEIDERYGGADVETDKLIAVVYLPLSASEAAGLMLALDKVFPGCRFSGQGDRFHLYRA